MTASPPGSGNLPASLISGVYVHRLTREQLLKQLEERLVRHEPATIVNVNVHALNLAVDLPWFRDFLNQASLAFCDGFGVKWGAAFLGQPLPERFTPPDWLGSFCARCREQQAGIFLLGANRGVAEKAARMLQQETPGLTVSGTHHGYFDQSPDAPETRAVIDEINRSGARVLLVGFGMPLQEQWLRDHRERLAPTLVLTVGAALDYVAGTVPRAPRWITDAGFEWLGRLWYEPRRLWKRYLLGNPRFLLRMVKERLTRPVPVVPK